jgi:hypothetical protein
VFCSICGCRRTLTEIQGTRDVLWVAQKPEEEGLMFALIPGRCTYTMREGSTEPGVPSWDSGAMGPWEGATSSVTKAVGQSWENGE